MKRIRGSYRKSVLAGTVAAVLLVSSASLAVPVQAAPATAQTNVTKTVNITWNPAQYEFDGVKMQPTADELGFQYKNSTYVPLRFVSYGLNKAVQWDQKTKTVTVADPSAKEQVLIGEYQKNAQYRALKGKTDQKVSFAKVSVQQVAITYLFDGVNKKPSAELPGLMYKGRIYVPMRFMGESLGQSVKWDKDNNAVVMMSKDYASSNGNSDNSNNNGSNGSNSGAAGNGNQTGGTGNNAGGGAGPGTPNQGGSLSYAEIVNKTYRELTVLENDAQSKLSELLTAYKNATTAEEKDRLRAEGENVFSDTTAKFNQMVNDTSKQLSANGHSTDVIQEYQAHYDKQVELGKKMLEDMQKQK